MPCDPSPGRRVACNSPSEGTRFRQSVRAVRNTRVFLTETRVVADESTLEASGIELLALRNHIPCMAHVIQLALGAFLSSLGVNGRTKSWEAHERDQQFGENESIDTGKSQRLGKEGNARINKVSAMRPGLAKIIEKVCIS